MSEAVMDVATGLPALPEGYWWSVEKSDQPWVYRPFFYRVAIRKTIEVEETRVRRDGFLGWFGVWRTVPAKVVESVVSSQGVVDEDGLAVSHLTPELIRAAAAEVLEDLNQSLTTEKLLGAYPPKVLEG